MRSVLRAAEPKPRVALSRQQPAILSSHHSISTHRFAQVTQVAGEAVVGEAADSIRGGGRPSRQPIVLIASDQESSSRSLESILTPSGYTVLKAYSGVQTLERAHLEPPDAFILDAILPDQAALEVCRALRSDPHLTPDTPIIVVNPNPVTRQQRIDGLRAGAWEYFGPPLDPQHLLLKLQTFTQAKLGGDRAREDGLVDQATRLYNLGGLARRARELGSQAARLNVPLACVAFAPDFGTADPASQPGEEAIANAVEQIAGAFQTAGRLSDAIGRMGPAEFAVVACATDAAGSVRLAERLARAVVEGAGGQPGDTARFRLRAGYDVIPDSQVRSADATQTILRAASALRLARAERSGSWIRSFAR
jgi:PleD family two-component response regulator